MEGLEISIKMFSEVIFDNSTLRFDSEYFKKEYLNLYTKLFRNECIKISSISSWATQGPNPNFDENGIIPCLTGRNINKGFVNYNNPDFVNLFEYESLKKFQLKKGDILITLKGKGSIGKIGFVTDERKSIFSRNIGVIRSNKIDSGFLDAFLLSTYGKKILERGETGGTGQSTLTTEYLKNIDVPRFSTEGEIGKLVHKSIQILLNSQLQYNQAENLLLETLGLQNFEPSKEPVNIKSFKESFLASGRLDAEYYQKKYENYLKLIKSYSNGVEPLTNICQIKDSNFKPKEKFKYKYIELTNIGKSGDITGCTQDFGSELPSRARRKVSSNDVIVSSIEGSLGSCALITEDYNNAVCSTGFYVLKSEKIEPETLLVLFKSYPLQNLLKKGCSGTILTAIGKPELEKIPIPIIENEIQNKIKEKIIESFRLKKQSEQLLELAKTAVEKAIEESEEVAWEFINLEVEKLGVEKDSL